uniref:Putative secreted protein n=1 Tax=Anopheles marajoara TaxID=58244 RepID=A0A2M4C6P8_9DIPT
MFFASKFFFTICAVKRSFTGVQSIHRITNIVCKYVYVCVETPIKITFTRIRLEVFGLFVVVVVEHTSQKKTSWIGVGCCGHGGAFGCSRYARLHNRRWRVWREHISRVQGAASSSSSSPALKIIWTEMVKREKEKEEKKTTECIH